MGWGLGLPVFPSRRVVLLCGHPSAHPPPPPPTVYSSPCVLPSRTPSTSCAHDHVVFTLRGPPPPVPSRNLPVPEGGGAVAVRGSPCEEEAGPLVRPVLLPGHGMACAPSPATAAPSFSPPPPPPCNLVVCVTCRTSPSHTWSPRCFEAPFWFVALSVREDATP